MKIPRALFLAFSVTLAAAAGLGAELDRAALYKHLPKAMSFPPGVEFMLSDLRPSPLKGFLVGKLEGRLKGRTQTWAIHITEDGKYYILSELYALGAPKLPAFSASTVPGDPNAPMIHLSKDGSRFLIGEFQDMTVDPDKANLSKVKLKGAPFRGAADAPAVLVEYSDLECPYCREAHKALEKELLPAFGKKLRWIFKHNPLPGHPWAYSAALAAACAAKANPDAAWKVEAGFFEDQEKITKENFKAKASEIAAKAGLDKGRFESCLEKQESKDAVEADLAEAKALGLSSTPAFLVNGRIVHGFRNFQMLKEAIDAVLAEKS